MRRAVGALALVLGGAERASAHGLKTARRSVDVAGGGTILRLGVPASGAAAIRKALRARKPVRAVITVLATDQAGNSSASKLPAVRLRR